jgi:hypothetical protein
VTRLLTNRGGRYGVTVPGRGIGADDWYLTTHPRTDRVVYGVDVIRARRPVHNFRFAHTFTIPGGEQGTWHITMPRKYDRTSAPQLRYVVGPDDGSPTASWSLDLASQCLVYDGDPALYDQYRSRTPAARRGTPS